MGKVWGTTFKWTPIPFFRDVHYARCTTKKKYDIRLRTANGYPNEKEISIET